ncbi:DUF11 domain-containing protein, partial [Algoriphagus sp. H41]|nr:DUF11 domain-containing protein [Algoriphagus oliviformis]
MSRMDTVMGVGERRGGHVFLVVCMTFLAAFLLGNRAYSQVTKTLANEVSYTSPNDKVTSLLGCGLGPCYEPTVLNAANALSDDAQYARLLASPGLLLGAGAYSGVLELKFGTSLPAETWSYVRIHADESLLDVLLGGSLGELLGEVLGVALLGNQGIEIQARNASNDLVLSRTSTQGFGSGRVKLVQDGEGSYFLAIKPAQAYDRIRIINRSISLVGLGTEYSLDVFNAFYLSGEDTCGENPFTSFDGSGILLDVLDLGGAGVSNAGNAIDSDPLTYSEISIGTLGLGSGIYQNVYFDSPSAPGDHFRVKLAMEGGNLLTAEVLGSIVVKAYLGDTEVYSQGLRDGLISGLDLLALLQSGATLNLPFGPGRAFDRVSVGIESLVSANVIQNPVRIFSIERFNAECPDPELAEPAQTISPFTAPSCAVELVDWSYANFPQNAIDGNGDSFAVLSASAGTALGLGAYSSHIELRYSSPVPAGETSYIRIGFEDDELDALLGGSLGSELADLLGTVALGDHYFTVTPKTPGGSGIYTASSQNGFGAQNVRVVRDASGKFYIAVTAAQAYQSVRIEHFLTSLLGMENTATMHVFGMCRETEFDLCEQAVFTDFDGSGIALSLADISAGGVFAPENAIDENSSNYSTINLGVAGVGARVYQNVYFKTKSQASDALRIRLQLDQPGILNLDLVGSYRVMLYSGSELVYDEPLQAAVLNNLDLLGLLNSGGVQELTIEPGVVYDRVSFGLQSVAAINTSAPIRLYGIARISDACPDPEVAQPPYLSPVCAEELVSSRFADNLQNLFDGNFNSYATINSRGGLVGDLGAFSGHIALGFGDGVTAGAGTTSYMRIDAEAGLLEALLAGSLGEVLGDLLNTVVLGNHYFNVVVNGTDGLPIFTASSANAFFGFNDQVKVVQDELGRYYLAITPDQDYSSIRIEDHTSSLLVGQANSINIYGLCYDEGAEACATGFTTSFDGTGLTLDAGAIGGYGVTNADHALDNNNNDDYSEISLGTLGVAGSIQQNIQFRQTIPASGAFKIKIGVGSGVLDAGVFARIDVLGYLDGVEVYDETLENAVLGNVNLVDLFNNGNNGEIRVAMGVEVDEVAVRLRSLVSVTAVPDLRLYYIQQDCETPLFQAWKSYVVDGDPALNSVSGGETLRYTIHVRNTGTVAMTDYLVTDAVPANTTYIAGSGGVESAGVVTFTGLNIAPGATETVSFSVLVNENLTGVDQISNVALVKSLPEDPGTETFPPLENENPSDPDESGEPVTDIPVQKIFSAEIWKAVTVDGDAATLEVQGGETLVYTIYIRNTGNQDLIDLVIGDDLPLGLSYSSGGTLTGNTVGFSIPSLAVGETIVGGTFTATVNEDLTGVEEIRNIARLSSAELASELQSLPPLDNTNPIDPDTTAEPGTVLDVAPLHVLDFAKIGLSNNAESDGKAVVGDEITYTLTVSNSGNKALSNVSVVDQIPANTTVIDNGGGTLADGALTFTIASLMVGESEELVFSVRVDAVSGSDPIINNAEAFYSNPTGGTESETAQHSMATDCVVVNAENVVLTADSATLCEGESTVLHASLTGVAISNPEFRWYLSADLSGSYFTGPDYSVTPSGSQTYYVIVVADGFCYSTPAAAFQITVGDLPEIPTASADLTISEGFGTTLSANLDPMPADVEIVWYGAGGTELGTGNTFDTGALSIGVYSYFAGARNTLTGCLSIGRDEVRVVVEPIENDAECTQANAQNNGTYAVCVLCTVDNPGAAVDGDLESYARFVAPVAVTGGVWQELVFGQSGAAGDTIVVTLGTGGSLLDLDLLGGLSFESYNGASGNNDGGVADNNLVHLRLLGGDAKGQVRFVAGGSFDRVRIEYRPLLGALSSGWRIYQAAINFPGPSAISEGVEVCQGETATLTATAAAGTAIRWYGQATGGSLLGTGASFTTAPLSSAGEQTFYIAVVRDGCEDPQRIPVAVTVNSAASAADINVSDLTICEGESVVLSALSGTVSNPVFRFYTDAALTTELTNLSVSPTATTSYYVTVAGDGVCENAPGQAAVLTVNVNTAASAADINVSDLTICEGESVLLSALSGTVSNPVFRFYTDAALTTELTNLSVSPTVTTSYYVTVAGDGVCENSPGQAAVLTVNVNTAATAADINVSDLTICEGESVVLSALSGTV